MDIISLPFRVCWIVLKVVGRLLGRLLLAAVALVLLIVFVAIAAAYPNLPKEEQWLICALGCGVGMMGFLGAGFYIYRRSLAELRQGSSPVYSEFPPSGWIRSGYTSEGTAD